MRADVELLRQAERTARACSAAVTRSSCERVKAAIRVSSASRCQPATSSCRTAPRPPSGTTGLGSDRGRRADRHRPVAARSRVGVLRGHDPHVRRRRRPGRGGGITSRARGAERVLARRRAGAAGREIHRISCEPCEQAGTPPSSQRRRARSSTEGFYHSLGHGVGLEVHEQPTLGLAPLSSSPATWSRSSRLLRPGFGGFRLEDLVVVPDAGAELLTGSVRPRALRPSADDC